MRPKKKSEILPKAEKRLAGMKSINAYLDLGNGCSILTIETQIDDVRQKLETYNTLLSKVDAAAYDFEQAEKELSSLSQKVLMGVAMKYNKESNEYEMVGGIRPSERRRSRRAATAAVNAATA
jgi:hypothetical protein